MSHIFVSRQTGEWDAVALKTGRHPLEDEDALLLQSTVDEWGDEADRIWTVLVGEHTDLHLNGEPLPVGVAVLTHRDELRCEGSPPVYFSTETQAEVVPYSRSDEPRCPRCAQSIQQSEDCVRCPSCGVLHHQRDDRACWTHVGNCALCDQPTDLDGSLQWSPEGL